MPTDAGTSRALRDRPVGRVLLFAAVLLAALLAARSCGSSDAAVSKEKAIEIARQQISYEPDGIQVKNVPQGVPARRIWAVSLYQGSFTDPTRVTVVEVDAETGEVREVHAGAS